MDVLNKDRDVRTAELKFADDKNALIKLKFNDISKTAETPDDYAAVAIDANGSDDSKLILFLNIGASSTDYTQNQFSAYATGVTDPNGVDSSPTHTQVATLGALITAINNIRYNSTTLAEDQYGVWATRQNAPADYSLDTDDFIDLTEVAMSPVFTEYLYRDVSEILHGSVRFGIPGDINGLIGNGRCEILRIQAYVNSGDATDCTFKLSKDPNEISADDEVEVGLTRSVPDAAWTTLWDFTNAPIVYTGPMLAEIVASSSMAANAQVLISYRNKEL